MRITWFSAKFIAKILDNSLVSFSFRQNEDAGNALWEKVLRMRNAVIPLAPPDSGNSGNESSRLSTSKRMMYQRTCNKHKGVKNAQLESFFRHFHKHTVFVFLRVDVQTKSGFRNDIHRECPSVSTKRDRSEFFSK